MNRPAVLLSVLLLGHLVTGEHSPVRLFFMKVFARYLEVGLLRLSYLVCRGKLGFLSRSRLFRLLVLYPVAYPFGHYGDTGRPVPLEELSEMIRGLEGKMAVGPCRCRVGHRACGHPLYTDIVIRTGTKVWLEAFPHDYREIDKEEALSIVEECSRLGMFHMVFMHCLVGGAVNEYVICNCCTDGCVPYILNRTLGQEIYPLVRGDRRAAVDPAACTGCGVCVAFCPFSARFFSKGAPVVGDCFGCGLCALHCPAGATRMIDAEAVT